MGYTYIIVGARSPHPKNSTITYGRDTTGGETPPLREKQMNTTGGETPPLREKQMNTTGGETPPLREKQMNTTGGKPRPYGRNK